MAMFLELFLGILTAMGGFVEIGELTFMLNAGSKFGYSLLWVVVIGTIGIMVYSEITGRIAAVRGQGVFNIIRERAGIRLGMLTLVSATFVCLLTTAAEIGAIALVWNLLSGWPYRPLLLVALAFLVLVVWFLKFQTIERVFGLFGLMMSVFILAAWKMHPNWGELAHGLVPSVPKLPPGQTKLYAFYAVSLFSSVLLPYEIYFYGSGVVEDHWTPKYIGLNRFIVLVGSGLGAILSISLLIMGKLYFGPANIGPALPGTAAIGAASVVGRAGLWLAVGGMFFAFAGAGIETAMSSAYNIAQFFGWTWGKYRTARGAPRFALAWIIVFLAATLIVLTGVDPIQVVEYSIVFSVVILPLTYFPMMAISRDPDTMGVYRNGWLSNTLGWLFFVIVCIAALAAIPLLVMTHGGQA